jgi:hypothetical protein
VNARRAEPATAAASAAATAEQGQNNAQNNKLIQSQQQRVVSTLTDISALEPRELALIVGLDSSAWIEGDVKEFAAGCVADVFLLRRQDSKLLMLGKDVKFDMDNGAVFGSFSVKGTGDDLGSAFKRTVFELNLFCASETRTKMDASVNNIGTGTGTEVEVEVEAVEATEGFVVNGLSLELLDGGQYSDEWICNSLTELLHLVESQPFAAQRWV